MVHVTRAHFPIIGLGNGGSWGTEVLLGLAESPHAPSKWMFQKNTPRPQLVHSENLLEIFSIFAQIRTLDFDTI